MNYTWTQSTVNEATDIMALSLKVQYEVDTIYNFNPNVLAHNIVTGLVNQFYTGKDLIVTTRDSDNRLLAYTWAHAGDRSIFSAEEIVSIRMAHVDPELSSRQRVMLIKDMIEIWERYAQLQNIPVIVSNTLRQEQSAFLKLHSNAGYTVRGSQAYKRVDLTNKPASLLG